MFHKSLKFTIETAAAQIVIEKTRRNDTFWFNTYYCIVYNLRFFFGLSYVEFSAMPFNRVQTHVNLVFEENLKKLRANFAASLEIKLTLLLRICRRTVRPS